MLHFISIRDSLVVRKFSRFVININFANIDRTNRYLMHNGVSCSVEYLSAKYMPKANEKRREEKKNSLDDESCVERRKR